MKAILLAVLMVVCGFAVGCGEKAKEGNGSKPKPPSAPAKAVNTP